MSIIHQRALLNWSLLLALEVILLPKSLGGLVLEFHSEPVSQTEILTCHIQIKEQAY